MSLGKLIPCEDGFEYRGGEQGNRNTRLIQAQWCLSQQKRTKIFGPVEPNLKDVWKTHFRDSILLSITHEMAPKEEGKTYSVD